MTDEVDGVGQVGAGSLERAGLGVCAWQFLDESDIALADPLKDSGEFYIEPRTRSASSGSIAAPRY